MEYSYILFSSAIVILILFVSNKVYYHFNLGVLQKYFLQKIIVSESELIRYNEILKKFEYFNRLSTKGKDRFLMRMVSFMNTKEFIGMEGLVVTEKIKVMISASATQLMFGLDEYRLWHFDKIKIYPKEFYHRMMDARLKGGTSRNGTIMLSWKDFEQGYAVPDDKINLGLHEFAHALKIDGIEGLNADDNFEEYIHKWMRNSEYEFENLKSGKDKYLRKYGAANMHEFFSVSVEHFFEDPLGFSKNLPMLYHQMTILLNQNPLNSKIDYFINELDEQTSREKYERLIVHRTDDYSNYNKNIKVEKLEHNWSWPYNIFLLGFFVGILSSALLSEYYVLDGGFEIMKLYLIIFVAGLLFQIKLFQKSNYHVWLYVVYNAVGFAPLMLSVCLLIGQVAYYKTDYKIYPLSSDELVSVDAISQNKISYDYWQYINLPEAIKEAQKLNAEKRKGKCLKVTYRVSIFGYHTFVQSEIINCKK